MAVTHAMDSCNLTAGPLSNVMVHGLELLHRKLAEAGMGDCLRNYQIVCIGEETDTFTPKTLCRESPQRRTIVVYRHLTPEQFALLLDRRDLFFVRESDGLAQDLFDTIRDHEFIYTSFVPFLNDKTRAALSLLFSSGSSALTLFDRQFGCLPLTTSKGRPTSHMTRYKSIRRAELEGELACSKQFNNSYALARVRFRKARPYVAISDHGLDCVLSCLFPIWDAGRDRVVGLLEHSNEIPLSEISHRDLVCAGLEALLDAGFSRARILAYCGLTQSLRGFAEASIFDSGKVGTDFTSVVLPADHYNAAVFKNDGCLKRSIKKNFDEKMFCDVFQKNNATSWLEIALRDSEGWLGKLVADKYHPTFEAARSRYTRFEGFQERALETLRNVLSERLRKEARFRLYVERDRVTHARSLIMQQLLTSREVDDIWENIVSGLFEHLKDPILTTFVRLPGPKEDCLELSKFGRGISWRSLHCREIDVRDPRFISARSYATGYLEGIHVHDDEKESHNEQWRFARGPQNRREQAFFKRMRARCSVPVITSDGPIGVLAVLGTDEILHKDFLDMLQEVCDFAACLIELRQKITSLSEVERLMTMLLRGFYHDTLEPLVRVRDAYIPELAKVSRHAAEEPEFKQIIDEAGLILNLALAQINAYGVMGGVNIPSTSQCVNVNQVLAPVLLLHRADPAIRVCKDVRCAEIEVGIDGGWISAILNTLVVNSVRAIDRARRRHGEVKITVHSEENFAVFTVEDNGCGFSESDKPKLVQGGFSTTNSGGLGLTLIQKLVERSNGEFLFNGEVGQGAMFQVKLPLSGGVR